MSTEYLDFRKIKAEADIEAVLAHFELLDRLERQGKEWVGWCPLGTKQHGKRDSFSFNIEKKAYQCFACKNRGSILDLAAALAGVQLREAAQLVAQISEGSAARVAEAAPGRRADGGGHIVANDRPLMTLAEAVRGVEDGELDVRDLVVLDLSTVERED